MGVFANAGIGGPNDFGPGDRWEEIIRINLTGTYNTLMACRPHLIASPTGGHALVPTSALSSWTNGVRGEQTGLLGLVRSLAVEWSLMASWSTRCWLVETEMAQASIQEQRRQGISYEVKAQQEALLLRKGEHAEDSAESISCSRVG